MHCSPARSASGVRVAGAGDGVIGMTRVIDRLMSRSAFIFVTIIALLYFFYDIRASALMFGTNLRCWNLPNITVTIALILALYLARQIDARMKRALRDLWLQGTLPGADDPTPALEQRIFLGAERTEVMSALLMMLVMVGSYAWTEAHVLPYVFATMADPLVDGNVKTELVASFFLPMVLGVISGLVAGAFFGRLATYGSAAAVLSDPETQLHISPGHFDGANGFRPVGAFYLFQALLTAIPLVWLSGWALALPWYHAGQCYAQAVDPAYTQRLSWQFYGQWLVVACFTYAAFIRPVLRLRHRLKRARSELLTKRMPEIENEIARLKTMLAGAPEKNVRNSITARSLELAREHWAIRNMRCWPMDAATFSKYAPLEIATNIAPILVGPMLSASNASGGATSSPAGLLEGLGLFLRRLLA